MQGILLPLEISIAMWSVRAARLPHRYAAATASTTSMFMHGSHSHVASRVSLLAPLHACMLCKAWWTRQREWLLCT